MNPGRCTECLGANGTYLLRYGLQLGAFGRVLRPIVSSKMTAKCKLRILEPLSQTNSVNFTKFFSLVHDLSMFSLVFSSFRPYVEAERGGGGVSTCMGTS